MNHCSLCVLSFMGTSRAIIIKHINAAADLQPMRFDEPNMPLDTTPQFVNPTPSRFRLTIESLTSALYSGMSTLIALIRRAMLSAGFSRLFVDFLTAMPEISADVIWAIGYSLVYPGTNITETVWDEIINGIIRYYSIPSPISDEILDAYQAVKDRGIFVFGDIFAAVERGWPMQGCLKWIIGIWKYDLPYHWPQTWDEAEYLLGQLGEVEVNEIKEQEDPEMLPGS